jgi:hypothetical protein
LLREGRQDAVATGASWDRAWVGAAGRKRIEQRTPIRREPGYALVKITHRASNARHLSATANGAETRATPTWGSEHSMVSSDHEQALSLNAT